jgi:hypothetical protein
MEWIIATILIFLILYIRDKKKQEKEESGGRDK